LSVGSTKPPTAADNQNEGTNILGVELNPNSNGGMTRLAVLLTPVGDRWPKLNSPALRPLDEWK
jgi:hypothetical protein